MATAIASESVAVELAPRRDDQPLFEIIDGRVVGLPPMSIFAVRTASRLFTKLALFNEGQSLGEAVSEGLFHLPLPVDRNRRPDLAFVSYQRWPKGRPQPSADNAWEVAPDLAVEVVSPNDLAEELLEKVAEYLRAGVHLVWVIYPRLRLAQVYSSLTAPCQTLAGNDELDGGAVLPGFKLPLATLFPEATP